MKKPGIYIWLILISCLVLPVPSYLYSQDENALLENSGENINDFGSLENFNADNVGASNSESIDNLIDPANLEQDANLDNFSNPSNNLSNNSNTGINSLNANNLVPENNMLDGGLNTGNPAANAVISDDAFIFDDSFSESNSSTSEVTQDEILFNDDIEDQGFSQSDKPPTGMRVLEQIEEPNLFAGAPPVPGTMKILAQSEAPEDYRVQVGDTLFDICDQLIDEAGYWPKLWSFNAFIRNPHFIYPGMALRFYPGGEDTPPFLRVVSEDDIVPVDKAIVSDKLLKIDPREFLIGNGSLGSIPVIGPNELNAFPEIDEAFITTGAAFVPDRMSVIIPAFIYQQEVQALGTVVGNTEGNQLLDNTTKVIIESENAALAPGTVYSIVRASGEVEDPESGDDAGYRYEFIGHIKVSEALPENSFSGDVVLNRLGIQAGDLVVSFRSVKRSVPYRATPAQVAGYQVLGFEQPEMEVAGIGSFVFFNSASGGGLTTGQTISVYQVYKAGMRTFVTDSVGRYAEKIADVHILDQSDAVATGYIIAGVKEVRIGDKTAPVSTQ